MKTLVLHVRYRSGEHLTQSFSDEAILERIERILRSKRVSAVSNIYVSYGRNTVIPNVLKYGLPWFLPKLDK